MKEELTNWLTAIGTIGAVLVALFKDSIARWWYRPKIEISYKHTHPFKEEKEDASSSSSLKKRLVIRVCIENRGKSIADNVVINTDEYYFQRGDNNYVRKLFTPKIFRDCNNAKLSVVAPYLKYYIDVATIEEYEENSVNENNDSKKSYKLYLLGDGQYEQLGRGTFVIPLKFYSPQTNSKIVYLSVFWGSSNFDISKDNFSVKILSEQEFMKLSIEE